MMESDGKVLLVTGEVLAIFLLIRLFIYLNSVALFRKRTIPIEQPLLAGEVNANLSE
jgi:hypothetical protein